MITSMVSKESLTKVKNDIEAYKGQKIFLKCNVGRNKSEYKEGVLTNTYSNVFNILDEKTSSNISYSYTDLLTNNLEVSLPNGDSIFGTSYAVNFNAKL